MSALSSVPTASFNRFLLWSVAGAFVLGVSLVGAQDRVTDGTIAGQSVEIGQRKRSERLREGTKIVDQLGYFDTKGESVTFVIETEDGIQDFGGLENLNLERIVRTLSENPNRLTWSITGTVTEYQGANFLQIERAVLKTKNVRRAGEQQSDPSGMDQT